MRAPDIGNKIFNNLDVLSQKAALLAISSPKLGKLAGLSVVVLKSATILPSIITQIILEVGAVIANAFGSIRSSNCRDDLSKSFIEIRDMSLCFIISPLVITRTIVNGFRGVWTNPTIPRQMIPDWNKPL